MRGTSMRCANRSMLVAAYAMSVPDIAYRSRRTIPVVLYPRVRVPLIPPRHSTPVSVPDIAYCFVDQYWTSHTAS
eukprot:2549169-Rhodomonas_salina.2